MCKLQIPLQVGKAKAIIIIKLITVAGLFIYLFIHLFHKSTHKIMYQQSENAKMDTKACN